MQENSHTHTDPDKKRVINLYAAFGVSMLLTLVPSMIVGIVAFLFLLGVLIAAYRMRARSSPESLAENHTTFIIRTIWIATLISLITLTGGSFYMLQNIDYSAFQPCAEALASKGPEFAANATMQEVYAEAMPCMDPFIHSNLPLLTISALITAVPVLLYLVARYFRGLSRAVRGYRLPDPKGWA